MVEIKPKKILFLKIILLLVIVGFVPIALTEFAHLNIFNSIAAAITALLFSILVLFFSFKPMTDLVKGANVLAGGNLNFRLNVRTGDELEQIADSFNIVAGKLQQAFSTLGQDKDVLSTEKNKLSMILSSIVDGIIAVDFSKRVVVLNKAAEEITGFNLAELQGRSLEEFIHLYADKDEIDCKTYCQPQFSRTLTMVGRNGKQVKINLTTALISESIQTNLGCILILHDLTHESELEQMKLDFVSLASHELKTPLTSITGYLSVFVDENKNKIAKEELELVEKALVASKQLYTLVQNILNVNRIERNQITISSEPVDLTPILQKAVEDLQDQAKLKNINISLSPLPVNLPKILSDPIRISEVVVNLISNAINYTNSGGKIQIYVQASPNEVVTTIEDTGVGIPPDAIPHLFNKFFRVSNTAQKSAKGTGLGLYIAKSIVEKSKGKIWVESEFGKGSKFHFSIPVASQISTGKLNTNQFVSDAIQTGALNYS